MRADAERLAQVPGNLLSNAIKFSPQGGEIVVTVEHANAMGRVTVRDHGPGVPDEFRSRIFGKFAQAETGDARLRGGSGLGLSIARQIATKHAGTLCFENAPDGGAVFCLEIPALDQEAGGMARPPVPVCGLKATELIATDSRAFFTLKRWAMG